MSERRELTEQELDALTWYWQASKHNPIRSGVFCAANGNLVPIYCRWCGTENIVTRQETIACPVCDAADRSVL